MTINIDLLKLEDIAITAGNAIMQFRSDGFNKEQKNDGSPVTEADLAADQIINDGLPALAPSIPAITEETFSLQNDQYPEQYWCVDPLDGTKGFINGGKDFTVNIALIDQRYPVLGVIYAPAMGVLWGGADGRAWKRSAPPSPTMTLQQMGEAKPITVRDAQLVKPDVVATKAHRSPQLERWIQTIDAGDTIAVGSSLKFCTIAEGDADLYPRMGPTMEWDTAAGQAILEAAGGQMVNPEGNRFSYGKPGRLNGYFTATARLQDTIPSHWLPPQD
jgi:3'(2'), 5'-bisphosphate nucleotidase